LNHLPQRFAIFSGNKKVKKKEKYIKKKKNNKYTKYTHIHKNKHTRGKGS